MIKRNYLLIKKIKIGFFLFIVLLLFYFLAINIYKDYIKCEYEVYINEGAYDENNIS